MEIYFLGTGAGMPSRQRNVTSIAFNLLSERGTYWLFDCGEGTQQQILRSSIKLSKTEKLFVTHLHGDHIYGIPGLLASRSYQGGETPFTVYGPKGIQSYIQSSLKVSAAHLIYDLHIVEVEEEGVLWEDASFRIETGRLEHRVECFGYRIIERDQAGTLQHEKLKALGIEAGPLYGQLKQGKNVELADGRMLRGEDFVGPALRGRKVVILGDTKVCKGSMKLAQGVDVLVHEATFAMDRQDLAAAYDHATTVDAARTAQEAGVTTLLLTHISSRYQAQQALQLLQEARSIHPNTYLAEDLWGYSIPRA